MGRDLVELGDFALVSEGTHRLPRGTGYGYEERARTPCGRHYRRVLRRIHTRTYPDGTTSGYGKCIGLCHSSYRRMPSPGLGEVGTDLVELGDLALVCEGAHRLSHKHPRICLNHKLGLHNRGFGSGFGACSGFRSRCSSFGFRVSGFGFRVCGVWFLVSGFWFLVSGFWFLVSGFWFKV